MQHIDLILKAWETYLSLAKGMGDHCWKIRSVFLSLAAGLLAYSYSSNTPFLYLLVSMLSVIFLIFESGYRRLEHQYFEKAQQIEITLNDILSDEAEPRIPPGGISTGVDTPDLSALFGLMKIKRIMFWLPYSLLFVAPIILWYFSIVK